MTILNYNPKKYICIRRRLAANPISPKMAFVYLYPTVQKKYMNITIVEKFRREMAK